MASRKSTSLKSFIKNPIFVLLFILIILIIGSTAAFRYVNSQSAAIEVVQHKNPNGEPDVTIYMEDNITDVQVSTLTEEIKKIPGVDRVNYISSHDAVNKLVEKGLHNNQITAEILPPSLEVFFTLSSKELEDQVSEFTMNNELVIQTIKYSDMKNQLELLKKISPTP